MCRLYAIENEIILKNVCNGNKHPHQNLHTDPNEEANLQKLQNNIKINKTEKENM